jgi:adenosylmethionine-8-amino-7-oxononanoate aminotransferase
LAAPLSPLAAAAREGVTLSLEPVRTLLEQHATGADVLLIEGIGGLMVPLWAGYSVADMAKDLDLPTLVVARPGLGTLNHTLLTIEAARARGIAVTAFAFSMMPDVELGTAMENAAVITAEAGIRCAGILPIVTRRTPEGWLEAARSLDVGLAVGIDVASSHNVEEIVTMDRTHLWHPFTQTAEWFDETPIVVARGRGCWLEDIDGHRYLDGVSSLWCNVHGHRHPRITSAIHRQLDRVAHTTLLGLTHEPAARLSAELVRRSPEGLERVFFSDAGATAVEVALRMTVEYWERRGEPQRTEFVSLHDAYHGDTIGAVSVGRTSAFHRALDSLLFPVHKFDSPHVLRRRDGTSEREACAASLAQLEEILERRSSHIAGCIIEPRVQGAAGILIQPDGYVAGVQDACRRHGVLFICDEVAVGFGRTGDMFASLGEGVKPDLMTLGKGLSGGYLPLAATLATEDVFAAFTGPYEELRTFFHGHTFTGNPLGCAAALASLEAFDAEDTLDRGRRAGAQLRTQLQVLEELPYVREVRSRGVMIAIELQRDPERNEPFPLEHRVGRRVCLEARRRSVIVRPLGDVVILMPPLVIQDDEIDLLATVVTESLEEVCAPLGVS